MNLGRLFCGKVLASTDVGVFGHSVFFFCCHRKAVNYIHIVQIGLSF